MATASLFFYVGIAITVIGALALIINIANRLRGNYAHDGGKVPGNKYTLTFCVILALGLVLMYAGVAS